MADEADRANDLFEDRRNVEIKAISRAIDRKSGVTECIDCDKPIPAGRIAVYPAAIRCVGCEDTSENRHKFFIR